MGASLPLCRDLGLEKAEIDLGSISHLLFLLPIWETKCKAFSLDAFTMSLFYTNCQVTFVQAVPQPLRWSYSTPPINTKFSLIAKELANGPWWHG